MNIYTHGSVDIDAAASVWAARTFVPDAATAETKFVPANWDGTGLEEGDLALDIHAAGRGVKGEKDAEGRVFSCFATLVRKYASAADQEALAPLVLFVDAQDAYGSAVGVLAPGASREAQKALSACSLGSVLRALQEVYRREDAVVVVEFGKILTGLLQMGRSRARAENEADKAELVGAEVAIVTDSKEFATNGVLFERGIRVVVYKDGHNIGLVRANGLDLRMDHPSLLAVVAEVGETEEWFAHSAGFLFCRGSRKAPAVTPSGVTPVALALAAASLL